jgi:hypothetical protein
VSTEMQIPSLSTARSTPPLSPSPLRDLLTPTQIYHLWSSLLALLETVL